MILKDTEYILITGGAGYIGSHTNKELNKRNINTIVFDNLVYGHKDFVKWGEFVEGDLSDIEKIRCLFLKYNIKGVIHFAAFAYVGESVVNPEKYYFNNVICTLNLLKVMMEFGVKNIVFSSSCATYGDPKENPISEKHPLNPINPYGRSKLMVEQILEDYAKSYGLRYVALRYFNAAGADQEKEIGEWHMPETHLIPLIINVALGVKDYVEIFGDDYETHDGTCIRDYIHVTDLALAHIKALEYINLVDKNLICNLGTGKGYSVKQVINTIKKVTHKDINLMISPRRLGDPAVLVANGAIAKEILGWKPISSKLETIIQTAWEWHSR